MTTTPAGQHEIYIPYDPILAFVRRWWIQATVFIVGLAVVGGVLAIDARIHNNVPAAAATTSSPAVAPALADNETNSDCPRDDITRQAVSNAVQFMGAIDFTVSGINSQSVWNKCERFATLDFVNKCRGSGFSAFLWGTDRRDVNPGWRTMTESVVRRGDYVFLPVRVTNAMQPDADWADFHLVADRRTGLVVGRMKGICLPGELPML
jgi:hypothetical protein